MRLKYNFNFFLAVGIWKCGCFRGGGGRPLFYTQNFHPCSCMSNTHTHTHTQSTHVQNHIHTHQTNTHTATRSHKYRVTHSHTNRSFHFIVSCPRLALQHLYVETKKGEKIPSHSTHTIKFTVTSSTKSRPASTKESPSPSPSPSPVPVTSPPYNSYLVDWVTVEIDLDHPAASDVEISLLSPKFTRSVFTSYRDDVPVAKVRK